jgi:hypothetical protein
MALSFRYFSNRAMPGIVIQVYLPKLCCQEDGRADHLPARRRRRP